MVIKKKRGKKYIYGSQQPNICAPITINCATKMQEQGAPEHAPYNASTYTKKRTCRYVVDM